MEAKLEALYAKKRGSYMGRHGGDVVKTLVPLVVGGGVMLYASYDAVMKQARTNWAKNQCDPIYMPFAGVIVPQPGKTALKTTVENFDYCIHRDVSGMFSAVLMPLEYVNYLILGTLDLMLQGMVQTLKLYAYLSSFFKESAKTTSSTMADFLVPVILMVGKMRDAMARGSATILTSVYTTYTVYSIIVSGLLNVTTIMLDLLIALAAALVAMLAVGVALLNPFTFPIGMAMLIVADVLLHVVLIPAIVIYTLLQMFMSATFGKSASPAPSAPKMPKIKKNKDKKKDKDKDKKKDKDKDKDKKKDKDKDKDKDKKKDNDKDKKKDNDKDKKKDNDKNKKKKK